ncbi:MAG TPA: hypothetical protein VNN08_21520 [Thermoanaerobaculia bacterium]|nr:hypothetical protein [Thermoanaerobaculia bacterium]
MKASAILFLFLSLTVPLMAQTHYGIGVAAGAQTIQRGSSSDTKLLSAVELFGQSGPWSAAVAGEWADPQMTIVHGDVTRAISPWFRVGAGPSYVKLRGFTAQTTWNVEAELVRPVARMEVLLRARYCPFHVEAFRDEAKAKSPAVYGGVRYAFGR